MGLRHTRTHTVYFNDENLQPLEDALAALESDWYARRGYMDEAVAAAGNARLAIVRHGLTLLAEEVAG